MYKTFRIFSVISKQGHGFYLFDCLNLKDTNNLPYLLINCDLIYCLSDIYLVIIDRILSPFISPYLSPKVMKNLFVAYWVALIGRNTQEEIMKVNGLKPYEILFVGNSDNDDWAYKSGARTLCVNPNNTDYTNAKKWHSLLMEMTNLKEIIPFILN